MTDNLITRWYYRWWKTDCRRCLQIRVAILWGIVMYIFLALFWW
ncbi:hypothetical protein [Neptunicella sp. SCSIO 80796]